ncbi:MAG: LamG domain-containing protein [Methanothrix sp.]|uniref:Pappalysin-1 SD scarf domain-containing protein n=1 Tax=Methanothrix harundinacea TaxID=301375 RepID=A0A101FSW9_9EURY|nr:MAG: Uncharacterized protein XD72_1811 [Methanothrix harundinacea]KUK96135.1 MAG: Uncharacterized protein XE07_1321 [Methanothrix harundinacea]MDD3710885.1 LamG domain-containing protein [Methanothrix sp.]MDD5767343.1 LamG domain-containing protein [Methanothrix sp.]MDI9399938.1 LamG domain-containing protein [Euryarchaeota archaeon]
MKMMLILTSLALLAASTIATPSEEMEDEIVALYSFFDGNADDATGRHPGELFGNASFVSEENNSPALKLDGSGDYVRVGNVHQNPTRALSQGAIEMWINLESAPKNFVLAASGREYGGSFDDGFYLGTHSSYSKNLVFMIWAGGWKVADSGIPPDDFIGEWRHVMGTWGPGGVEIWVDGILRGTNTHTGGLTNPNYSTVLIGTDSWRSDAHGLIGGVVIYDIQSYFSDGSVDGSEEMGPARGKPKCADFDCREDAPCQSSYPLPSPVVDYMDIGASKTDRYTAGPLLDPGTYLIWSGKRASGEIGVSDDWKAYGPFTLTGGKSYLFDVWSGTLEEVDPWTLSSMLNQASPNVARLWYKRPTMDPQVVCVERALGDPVDGADADELRQWAARATASSEYSSTGWAALQATGEPDTYPDHGDIRTAWASLEEDDGIQWLDLEYEVPVSISRIDIYETFNPGAIAGIEIYDLNGERQLAWEGSMEPATEARISAIEIDSDFTSDRIRIILDTNRVSGWNEIDAVALIGTRSLPQSGLWSHGDVLIDAPPGGWEGVMPGEAI